MKPLLAYLDKLLLVEQKKAKGSAQSPIWAIPSFETMLLMINQEEPGYTILKNTLNYNLTDLLFDGSLLFF